ncbi:MAG: post-transcriptional regulator [Paenibacillus sp.]|nr:post-transcriptional regulator [Paenibacillus sp.]
MNENALETSEQVVLTEQELNEVLEDLCISKADEFRMLGYEHVTGEEVWQYFLDKYKKRGIPLIHERVNDILTLRITTFMNWMTMNIYRNDIRF